MIFFLIKKDKKQIRIKLFCLLLYSLLLLFFKAFIKNNTNFVKDFKKFDKIKVCLCTIAKEENKYIREFVQHYEKIGVDKIFLYDNNDVDGEKFDLILKDYLESGFVKILNWRGEKLALFRVMNNCYNQNYKFYDWILFYEIDEFIHLYDFKNIKLFLYQKKFDKCQMLRLNLVCHTDNNHLYYENKSLAERFPSIVPKTKPMGNIFEIKTIIRGHIEGVNINHNHLGDQRLNSCNSSGIYQLNKYDNFMNSREDKFYYIDHYYSKSTEEFINKITKGDPLRTDPEYIHERIAKYFMQNEITKEKIIMIEEKTHLNLSRFKKRLKS